jgi:hypothetical protein
MPQNVNLTKSEPGVNPAVVSVRAWFYPAPWGYPQPQDGPITPGQNGQPAEIAGNANQQYQNAHFLVYEGFSGTNESGTSLGRGSVDCGAQTLSQAFPTATSIETLLATAFPAPGPN